MVLGAKIDFWRVIYLQNRELVYKSANLVYDLVDRVLFFS
jgi:hypothetical protein